MEEGKQSFEQAHKTVASLFDAAEACKELPYADQELMLKEVCEANTSRGVKHPAGRTKGGKRRRDYSRKVVTLSAE
jgi:hypothetical protein